MKGSAVLLIGRGPLEGRLVAIYLYVINPIGGWNGLRAGNWDLRCSPTRPGMAYASDSLRRSASLKTHGCGAKHPTNLATYMIDPERGIGAGFRYHAPKRLAIGFSAHFSSWDRDKIWASPIVDAQGTLSYIIERVTDHKRSGRCLLRAFPELVSPNPE